MIRVRQTQIRYSSVKVPRSKKAIWKVPLLRVFNVMFRNTLMKNCSAYGIIVTDIRAAMACIAQAFYNNPQDQLFKIGITGTKGKTSCAYFVREILAKTTNQKVAFFSSEENTVDGKNYQEAVLTTPENVRLVCYDGRSSR